jgi:hypothetical protein
MTLTPTTDSSFCFKRIEYHSVDYDPCSPDYVPEEEQPQQEEDEDNRDFWDRELEWRREYCQNHLVLPDPGDFEPPNKDILSTLLSSTTEDVESGVNLWNQYNHKNLQVIVKLANIQLTPEKPSYEGGTWHVEGQLVSEF